MTESRPELAELIRSCVQCGLCLPHCATYLASGNEALSPRGRLVLLADLLASGEAPDESYLASFDQCIGCQACSSVCPSGVPFSLIAHGQHLAAGRRGVQPEPAVPAPILRRLDSVAFLKGLGGFGRITRGLLQRALGRYWRRRLQSGPPVVAQLSRLLASLPRSPESDAALVRLIDKLVAGSNSGRAGGIPAPSRAGRGQLARPQLLFFRGCANAGLLAASSRRLLDTLRASGFAVEIAEGQDCCGAMAAHTGRPGRAAGLRRRNLNAFQSGEEPDLRPIVVEAAGCALELAEYGPEFGGRVVDAVSLLADTAVAAARSVPLLVALHDPCHARHGRGITAEPRLLLEKIPALTWCEAAAPEVCCGSGGAWGLRYPEMSADLARRKAADLAATGADLVVTTNPGCLGQIADGLALEAPELPILPLTDLWWYANRP